MGEYHVLSGDFHVHCHPFGWSMLSPWDTVLEANRQGLDVIALTPHNLVWQAKAAKPFANWLGHPIVIVGEEITARGYHLLAIGIHDTVSNQLSAAAAIDEIHRQGGLAIAAHPYEDTWPAWDAKALAKLDAAEIVRPETFHVPSLAAQLRAFSERATLTAMGSSDYHSLPSIGYARTWVFAKEHSEAGVMEALRARRTVVFDRERAYGDPAMIRLVEENGGLPTGPPTLPAPGWLRFFSRLAAVAALAGIFLFNRERQA
jgi:predicted metal-dependent phosphoesterase TrpH